MKINRKHLYSNLLSPEGIALQYKTELYNIGCEPDLAGKLSEASKLLRTLLRCLDNLTEAKSSLLELESYLTEDEIRGKYQFVARSLFSHAVVNYASCFLRGGKDRKAPLEVLTELLLKEKCHIEIMNYRKKLIGHLDENDDLREDKVVWVFQNTIKGIVPINPELSSFKTLLLRDPNENQWIAHIEKVIDLVKQKVFTITKETNESLKSVEVVEHEIENKIAFNKTEEIQEKISTGLSGLAGEYFVAAELSRKGYMASIMLRNNKGIDILAANSTAAATAAIQVKTNQGYQKSWILNKKCEEFIEPNFFYIFVNLETASSYPEFHIIPGKIIANFIKTDHQTWLNTPGKNGQKRNDTTMRKFHDLDNKYLDRWDLLQLD